MKILPESQLRRKFVSERIHAGNVFGSSGELIFQSANGEQYGKITPLTVMFGTPSPLTKPAVVSTDGARMVSLA
jgi:hypothetical protein